MVAAQRHRGPDAEGIYLDPSGQAALGHNRLSILDLSDAGRQPMSDPTGRYWLLFNGEVYNYLELRAGLDDYPYRSRTDTEVLLAAYRRWGEGCLHRLIGMFAFAVWDAQEKMLFAARDRFGVKPFYYHVGPENTLLFASEIKALHAAGVEREPDPVAWATYLARGMYDHGERTFWQGVRSLPPGACLTWRPGAGVEIRAWYDLAEAVCRAGVDARAEEAVGAELLSLLEESVRLRFRSDVPVGVCLSGGLDSSLLLALIHRIQGADSDIKSFTFCCGDPAYDETPWVEQMVAHTRHPACFCLLRAEEVSELAERVQRSQDEPFGGLPTLGMAKVHARAREEGVTVLLDGNGMDEGWAGYEYYARAASVDAAAGPVQGSRSPSTRPDCLNADFAALAEPPGAFKSLGDPLRDLQYRDIRRAKIPRAMRFADRVSMLYSRELREPFLDHRLLELGLRQPVERKIRDGQGKWLPRRLAGRLMPEGVREAPKRPVQTPQREWLRGPLWEWADAQIRRALDGPCGAWLSREAVEAAWLEYGDGASDNSFYVWQWVSLGMLG
jgi:asparagine synthase (glutamine-hydrolysing)